MYPCWSIVKIVVWYKSEYEAISALKLIIKKIYE
jgi:hypothetical protein